jgi:hypothetical protein
MVTSIYRQSKLAKEEELKAAYERISQLKDALKHAQEAIFWYGALGFEQDGKTVGQVLNEVLA